MKIKKGELLEINHTRKGVFKGVATEDFDTEKNEFYPIVLAEEIVYRLSTSWLKGEKIPCGKSFCSINCLGHHGHKKQIKEKK